MFKQEPFKQSLGVVAIFGDDVKIMAEFIIFLLPADDIPAELL